MIENTIQSLSYYLKLIKMLKPFYIFITYQLAIKNFNVGTLTLQ